MRTAAREQAMRRTGCQCLQWHLVASSVEQGETAWKLPQSLCGILKIQNPIACPETLSIPTSFGSILARSPQNARVSSPTTNRFASRGRPPRRPALLCRKYGFECESIPTDLQLSFETNWTGQLRKRVLRSAMTMISKQFHMPTSASIEPLQTKDGLSVLLSVWSPIHFQFAARCVLEVL